MHQLTMNPYLNIRFCIGVLSLMTLLGCSSDKNSAPDRNFYFEVITHHNDDVSMKLADYVRDQIPLKKYTITNQSGLEWPFYRALDLNERISKDSLMPPHWFVHRMIPFKKNQEIGKNEFLVRIEVQPKADTLPNYRVEIFKKDSTGLKLMGQGGLHFIDSTVKSEQLFPVYLKSIIRSSFK